MKLREFETSSGKKVLAGKNAEQNDELVEQFIGKGNKIFHTAKPGSPFCVIESLKPNKKDLQETAIFCASKSQDWRDNKNDVAVHVFTGKNVYKEKRMKTGMFGVRKFSTIVAKKKEIERFSKLIKSQ
ncbi:MAG: NFACT RNA binding domain-containing protein [Candidatus Nanoarchaeia archaeon]|nr:NFACT RNA binding domain-containing protein [Candidatus Nanoarchaeia archaeon]MDD5357608.1 NFACT RNA binding domain-containing protein [Candidatus Nanoarchaeia archaeon]MDD5588527.1 NFACT RNA binding domain-containing protein [Candidatus Nanoarchaeia archaeon]